MNTRDIEISYFCPFCNAIFSQEYMLNDRNTVSDSDKCVCHSCGNGFDIAVNVVIKKDGE